MEHRCGERSKRNDRIRIGKYPQAGNIAILRDLSMTGAFVTASLRLPLYSVVHCLVPIPEGQRSTMLELTGYIVRATRDGFGIEWDEDSAEILATRLNKTHDASPAAAPSTAVGSAVPG